MSYLDQLSKSIDARIVELKNEITALDTARTALGNGGAAREASTETPRCLTSCGNSSAAARSVASAIAEPVAGG